MFGPNVADKYASAITNNLGLGPCSLDHFHIIHATSSVNKIIPTFQEQKKLDHKLPKYFRCALKIL